MCVRVPNSGLFLLPRTRRPAHGLSVPELRLELHGSRVVVGAMERRVCLGACSVRGCELVTYTRVRVHPQYIDIYNSRWCLRVGETSLEASFL